MILKSGNLIIKRTRNGKGVFANKNFVSGEKIIKIKGNKIDVDIFVNLSHKVRSNSFRLDYDTYLHPKGEVGYFFNHSCNPNSKIKKIRADLFLFSTKRIKNGSEIFFDYSTNTAEDDWWKMKCNCGEKSCRKIISKFNLLPKKLQDKYTKSKIVPEYILEIKD